VSSSNFRYSVSSLNSGAKGNVVVVDVDVVEVEVVDVVDVVDVVLVEVVEVVDVVEVEVVVLVNCHVTTISSTVYT